MSLITPPIHLLRREFIYFYPLQTSYIHRVHSFSVVLSLSKGLDSTGVTEVVVDMFFVELIVRKRLFSTLEREVLFRYKTQNSSTASAHGAVTGHGMGEIDLGFKVYVATVTTAGVGFWC